jgi:FAD/FMN-containing dehydrogenase
VAALAEWVDGWARPGGIPVVGAAELGGWTPGPRTQRIIRPTPVVNLDARTDYGRIHHRTPACVLEPRTEAELAACVRRLAEARVPFAVRGAGNSSGGQVLSEGGVVIATRRLRGVVADDPAGERIQVRGGTLWSEVMRHLGPQGRRPPVLIGNQLTSVGGTLSSGGVGGTSLLHGMQIACVTGLTLVLPTGDTVEVGPDDDLFRYTLGGAGQLGIVARAELATVRRPPDFLVRLCAWATVRDFVEAAIRIRETERFEVFAGRFVHDTPERVAYIQGRVGVFCDGSRGAPVPAGAQLWDQPIPDEDAAPEPARETLSPSLLLFLPLPDGIPVWDAVVEELRGTGVMGYMATSSPVGVLRRDGRFPVAPFPASDDCLFFGIRPEVPPAELERVMAVLRGIAARVLDAGGKLELTSTVRPQGEALDRQLGAAAGRFRALKAQVDPHGLLNPGLLS